MSTQRIGIIIGTRPEAIKLAPVVRVLNSAAETEVIVIATGQHREMLRQMLADLELRADIDLDLMTDKQTLAELTSKSIAAVSDVLSRDHYDAIVVQGDTTTAMSGALAAFYDGVPVAHVEAGLRTGWTRLPFPEEANRRIIGEVARWHFAPTAVAASAISSAPRPRRVAITGNTAIDTLMWAIKRLELQPPPVTDGPVRRMLVTLHRRESQGGAQRALCEMVARLAHQYRLTVTLPVHPNPCVAEVVSRTLSGRVGIRLVEPLDYFDCVREIVRADLILTDSGGIQEEAPTLNTPVVVLRDTTERPEGIAAGCTILAGSDAEKAEPIVRNVIEDSGLRGAMANAKNPYGDGRAADRIARILRADLDEVNHPSDEQPRDRVIARAADGA